MKLWRETFTTSETGMGDRACRCSPSHANKTLVVKCHSAKTHVLAQIRFVKPFSCVCEGYEDVGVGPEGMACTRDGEILPHLQCHAQIDENMVTFVWFNRTFAATSVIS